MRPAERVERVLRWGFAASLVATFALVVAHVAVDAAYPRENLKAALPWTVLQSEVTTAKNVALMTAFVFLAATWYRRGRARVAVPIAAPTAGLACVLTGVLLGASAYAASLYLLGQGRLTFASDPEHLVPDALAMVSLPLVALGLGLMTFSRARRPPPPPPPEDAPAPDGRNP